jgi:hypothetical protein
MSQGPFRDLTWDDDADRRALAHTLAGGPLRARVDELERELGEARERLAMAGHSIDRLEWENGQLRLWLVTSLPS